MIEKKWSWLAVVEGYSFQRDGDRKGFDVCESGYRLGNARSCF